MKCPKCGNQLKEQPKFPGLYTCANERCKFMHITHHSAGQFSITIEQARKERYQVSLSA